MSGSSNFANPGRKPGVEEVSYDDCAITEDIAPEPTPVDPDEPDDDPVDPVDPDDPVDPVDPDPDNPDSP